MSEHCGTTTEEGNAVCIPGSCSCSSESKSDLPASPSMDSNQPSLFTRLKIAFSVNPKEEDSYVEENS
jgi:hypothetical protein